MVNSDTPPHPNRPAMGLCLLNAAIHLLSAWPRTTDGIQGVDGAEFAMAAVRGSLVHPPGYPVVTTMMHGLWQLTGPWDNPMAMLSHLCALQNAIACGVWTWVLLRLGPTTLAAAAGLCLALQPSLLHTSTDVDVFASLHLTSAITTAVLVSKHRSSGWLWLATVLTGIAGAVHPMAIAMTPLLAVALWQHGKARSVLLGGAVAVVVSLACYGLLWVRHDHAPDLAFLPIHSHGDWLRYVLRSHYGTLQSGSSDDKSVGGLWTAATLLWTAPLLVIAVILGCVWARTKHVLMAPIVAVLLHVLLWWQFRIPGHAGGEAVLLRFMPQGLWCMAIVAVMVLPTVSKRWWMPMAMVVPALLALPSTLERVDARNDRALDAYARRLFQDAPKNALLWTQSDGLGFGTQYLQAALGMRPDLVLRGRPSGAPDATRTWMAGSEVPPPTSTVRRPTGIGFRFFHHDEGVPSRDETMVAIITACTTIPDEVVASLALMERPEAGQAAGMWMVPLEGLAQGNHPLASAAGQALTALRDGDLNRCHAVCAEALASYSP
jgi:Protein of unknown function (DUF2723)